MRVELTVVEFMMQLFEGLRSFVARGLWCSHGLNVGPCPRAHLEPGHGNPWWLFIFNLILGPSVRNRPGPREQSLQLPASPRKVPTPHATRSARAATQHSLIPFNTFTV